MSVNRYNSTTGELERISGGLLYADAPIGSIQAYGGTTAPSGWLLCQGQAISRTDYSDLFNAIGTAFGTGDGSTTFNVPDLRETVPVGTGTRESGVADHDTYTLGKFKDDQMQKIDGTFRALSGNVSNPFYEKSVVSETYAGSSTSSRIIGFDTSRSARTGTTTHGKQLGVNYIIKAKQVAVPFDVAEYIRNQNVLSEWEDPICDGYSFTALYDGILNMWLASDAAVNATVRINSVMIARLYPNAGIDSGTQLPIKKGDILTFSLSSGVISNIYKKVAYYKLRDYKGR